MQRSGVRLSSAPLTQAEHIGFFGDAFLSCELSLQVPHSTYVHVPFCIHRCGYCNFTLVADRDDLVEPYFESLAKELSWLGGSKPVQTLYFGGGTPTYLNPKQLARLCEITLAWHPLESAYEWTVEANPADLTAERIQVLSEFGVNRLSLGVQSFQPDKLKLLERDHRSKEIHSACTLAQQAGMNLSIDLIFGAPGETVKDWERDLEAAIALQPDHISTYGLTFEKGTNFWSRLHHGELTQVPEEIERDMYLLAIDRLAEAGFEHYEISNFAQSEKRSRHNEVYWAGEEYFAAGPGAARYVDGVRSTNHRSTFTYLKRLDADTSPIAESEKLSSEQRAREMLVFGLRRLAGIDKNVFHQQTGFRIEQLAQEPIVRFVGESLLQDDGSNLRLTRKGLLVSDGLWPDLL